MKGHVLCQTAKSNERGVEFLFSNAPGIQHSKGSKLTDVVCCGSIHIPPLSFPPFSSLVMWGPPWHASFFSFFAALSFTNNVPVTYFSPNYFPPSVFRAGHAQSGRGKYRERRQKERKACLTGSSLHSQAWGIHSTRAGISCWFDNNRSTSQQL